VQVVFQDPFSSLSPRMTVEEIVGEGLLVHHPELTSAQRRERVASHLHDVGLTAAQFPGLLQRYPHGVLRRPAAAAGDRPRADRRALGADPGRADQRADVTIQKQVLKLLQRLQREKGLSYLLITHDVDVISAMAHDVLVMKDGEVVESGTVEQVLKAPRNPYTQVLVAAAA
jgi:microcin C transport system ATP-binding protein